MGFNYYNYGTIQPCWVKDKTLFWEDASGNVRQHTTTLEDAIPRQCNVFYSVEVAFYLEYSEKVYIGRFDGVISIYRKRDMLLVGIQHWEPPQYPVLKTAGYARGQAVLYPIYLDTFDYTSVYCTYRSACSRLLKPYTGEFLVDGYVIEALRVPKDSVYNIFSDGGEYIVTDVWSIQDDLWRRNCKSFL